MSNPRYANGNARRKQRARLRRLYSHCPMCGVALDWDHPYQDNSAELDEIIPVSKVPQRLKKRACVDPNNLQVLCRRCNKLKLDRLPWQMELGDSEPDDDVEGSQRW